MKKAKIFLSVIAVFAVVGGALAFKAKTVNDLFCTRLIDDKAGVCEAGLVGKKDPAGNAFYYTVTGNIANCGQTDCNETTFLTVQE